MIGHCLDIRQDKGLCNDVVSWLSETPKTTILLNYDTWLVSAVQHFHDLLLYII